LPNQAQRRYADYTSNTVSNFAIFVVIWLGVGYPASNFVCRLQFRQLVAETDGGIG
jgi:hypothetical protein